MQHLDPARRQGVTPGVTSGDLLRQLARVADLKNINDAPVREMSAN
jgi:hypothetical protein